jgi:hypothetical protein
MALRTLKSRWHFQAAQHRQLSRGPKNDDAGILKLDQEGKMDKARIGIGQLTLAMTLVWTSSWSVSWVVGWSVVRCIGLGYSFTLGGEIGGVVGGIIAGLCGGIGTAILLKLANPSTGMRKRHAILLAVGWAIIVFYDWSDGFVVAAPGGHPIEFGMIGPLSGILGGVLTALILLWADHTLGWIKLLLIIGGWTLGFSLAGLIAWTIGFNIAVSYVLGPIYSNDPGVIGLLSIAAVSGFCGALVGWLGGSTAIRQFSPRSLPEDETSETASDKLLFE